MTNKKQAFTLIELLVVITIIGLLSTLAVFALNSASMKARDAKRMSDLKMISEALEIYNMDNDGYPEPADWTGYTETDCGSDGVLNYAYDMGGGGWTTYLCKDNKLKSGNEVYIESIPEDPLFDPFHSYYYEGINIYFGDGKPCVYVILEEMDGSNYVYFVCKSGNCQRMLEHASICGA